LRDALFDLYDLHEGRRRALSCTSPGSAFASRYPRRRPHAPKQVNPTNHSDGSS
jgi:hypothetical protein